MKESTAGLTTVTGFFEHNSVVLHIGDELVTFGGVSQQAPWRFTGVKRGVLGTKAASHEQGAKARQLKECFGLFVPMRFACEPSGAVKPRARVTLFSRGEEL